MGQLQQLLLPWQMAWPHRLVLQEQHEGYASWKAVGDGDK